MLKFENKAVLKNERLRTLRSILMQPKRLYRLDSTKRIQQNVFRKCVPVICNYKNYILNYFSL